MSWRTTIRMLLVAGLAFLVGASGARAVLPDPFLTVTGENNWDRHGSGVCLSDLDGDGYADLIVGAHLANGIAQDAGRVWVYRGGPTADAAPDYIMDGEQAVDHFGLWPVAGDLNGDTYEDLLVGAQLNDGGGVDAGRAYVFFGGPGFDTVADVVYTNTTAGERFGGNLALVDVNGDGCKDAVIGAHWAGSYAGKVVVYFGGAVPDAVPDLVLTGEAAGDYFGITVGCVGDMNGDGFEDIKVGAMGNDVGGTEAGRVYVFLGGSPPDAVPDLVFTGSGADDRLGWDLYRDPGDWNGDGYADLVIGDYRAPGGGCAVIFLGGPTPDSTPDHVIPPYDPGLWQGTYISYAGDIDDDGYDDLLVSATGTTDYSPEQAVVQLYRGGAVPDVVVDGILMGDPAEGFGVSPCSGGDFDGDGETDFAAGAIWWHSNTGRAHVFAGPLPHFWHVPGDAPDIQAGLDLADDGDVVLVACGTYFEHDLVMRNGVTLCSETGQADCVIIDAQRLGRVIDCDGLTSPSRLQGVTLTGGTAARGGAVRCAGSRLTIDGCLLSGNEAGTDGGAVHCIDSELTIRRSTFAGNTCSPDGSALCLSASTCEIEQSIVAFNEGMAIRCADADPVLSCCDLFGNTGGDWLPPYVAQVLERGNFAADPCFCDAAGGSYWLCSDSWCLAGNHDWGCNELAVGALPDGCDACDCYGPVAVFLVQFDLERRTGIVTATWRTTGDEPADHYRLRAAVGNVAWTVGSIAGGGGWYQAVDDSPLLLVGGVVTYSLDLQLDSGAWQQMQQKAIELPPLSAAARLGTVAPNPFNPSTRIEFVVPIRQQIRLRIFSLDGRRVAGLVDRVFEPGRHTIEWDGRDDRGRTLASGAFLIRLDCPTGSENRKLTLIR